MTIGKYDVLSADGGAGYGDPERLGQASAGNLDELRARLVESGGEPAVLQTLPVEIQTSEEE